MCQEEETGQWVLTGVVAGGYGCSDPSSPALYARVGRFKSWVDEVMGVKEAQHRPTRTDGDLSRQDEHARGELKYKEPSEVKHTRLHAKQQPHMNAHTQHAEGGDKNQQTEV